MCDSYGIIILKDNNYIPYLIKHPGVYFISKFIEGAFIVMSTPNSCTAAVIMLFLAVTTALSLNLKS